ncbi:hypothetical protein [Rhizobium sp. MHM7A]|uniref:hypothetical protein n=1 Tax=Rhizobium sp. MHM7A TaxID=2583233 RepID=UPI001106F8E6|nr:hypothetical protein [Rhizobium sp. MHM7A]TLX17107.1 hypothetical protein FFR93_07290 [Rhizobium sp. MHM7A]
MAILRYPIPYQIYAVPKGMRQPREIDVADEVAFNIPNCDDMDAPVVARVHKEWPSSVFPADSYQKRNNIRPPERPITEIRSFDGKFYAAVVINRGVPHSFAKVEDLDDVMGGGLNMATSFTHLYAMRDEKTAKRLALQRSGNLKTLDEIPHSKRDLTTEKHVTAREYVLEFAREDARQYIAIDGFLWRAIAKEPKLQYEVPDTGPIAVSMETPSTRNGKRRLFNLNRLDDLIDHLETNYPGRSIDMQLYDLEVSDPSAFTFDDEAETMWTVGHELRQHLSKKIDQMPEDVAEAWYDLRDELQKTNEGNAPEKAELFAELSTKLLNHFADDKTLNNARRDLERWHMRPAQGGTRLGFGG